mgnify:CR=1 FL=1
MQKLLILQDRDARRDSILAQIDRIPSEMEKEQARIEEVQGILEERAHALKAMEARRLDLEGEVAAAEEAVVKYKTQQMQVKKNEEYTALEKEIENLKVRVSELEDAELQLMEEIEVEEESLKEARESGQAEIATLKAHMERLQENLQSSKEELGDAEAAMEASAKEIEPEVLQQYRYVKSQIKRPPVVVALQDGRCQGCHLKVSGDVESMARRAAKLVRCDACGRILYFERS